MENKKSIKIILTVGIPASGKSTWAKQKAKENKTIIINQDAIRSMFKADYFFDKEYEPGNRIKRVVTTKPDLMSQIINITFRFEWNDKDDFYSREWKSSLRYFFRSFTLFFDSRICFCFLNSACFSSSVKYASFTNSSP